MKKYTQLLVFGILLLVLWVVSIECLHVFFGWSRNWHMTSMLPFGYIMWILQGTWEHRVLIRAMNYRFKNHSKELVWREVFEIISKMPDTQGWWVYEENTPTQLFEDSKLVHKENVLNLCCVSIVNRYRKNDSEKNYFRTRTILRRWETKRKVEGLPEQDDPNNIYIVAAILRINI